MPILFLANITFRYIAYVRIVNEAVGANMYEYYWLRCRGVALRRIHIPHHT